jgi:uncharacterized membrane protein YcaP (DUF421 family)
MSVDWTALFQPSLSLAEIVIRGSLMYLALFIILRFIARRQAGSFGPADLLVIVLIADASQNALGKDYTSITEGVLLVLTIVAWEYLIDWLAWRFPALRPVLQVPPLQLIADGKTLRENLAREMITEDELRGQLRQRGIGDIGAVQESFLEGDGKLSVLKRDQ